MAHDVFPYDRHGNFVKAAADVSHCPDPFLLVSSHPFHTVPACALPEGMKADFSQVIGYRSEHGENSLATESLNASISSHYPSAVEDLLAQLSYTSLGEDDPVGVLPVDACAQAPVGVTTSRSDDYLDADFNETTELYSWSGEAALEYEKWIDRVVAEHELEVDDDQYSTYPHFGGRAGFLSAEPIINALTKYAVSDHFLLTNRCEDIQVLYASDLQQAVNVKFADGAFSISLLGMPLTLSQNVSLANQEAVIRGAKYLSSLFDDLEATQRDSLESGRESRKQSYCFHILRNLPEMMDKVATQDMPPLAKGIAVCELNDAIKSAVEDLSPAYFRTLPLRVRAQLPALYEDRSPTVREKIMALVGSAEMAAEVVSGQLANAFNKKSVPEQKSAPDDISSGPSM